MRYCGVLLLAFAAPTCPTNCQCVRESKEYIASRCLITGESECHLRSKSGAHYWPRFHTHQLLQWELAPWLDFVLLLVLSDASQMDSKIGRSVQCRFQNKVIILHSWEGNKDPLCASQIPTLSTIKPRPLLIVPHLPLQLHRSKIEQTGPHSVFL